MKIRLLSAGLALVLICLIVFWTYPSFLHKSQANCTQRHNSLKEVPEKSIRVRKWVHVIDLPKELAVAKKVFWEPLDTESLRKEIRETALVKGKSILEIGTGSGLIALCCLQAGAKHVVATDINPNACACALYNAKRLDLDDRLDVRVVPLDAPGAFAVIDDGERFDLILSNPPWEDLKPHSITEYALYDQNFALMQSLVKGLKQHLKPGGKALLAYGSVSAIKTLTRLAEEQNLDVRILDKRKLDRLPEMFLPGMLIELSPRD